MEGCFSVTLVSNEAKQFYGLHASICDFVDEKPSKRFRYLSIGRYDQLILTVSDIADELAAADRLVHASPFADHHASYFGRILHASRVSDLAAAIAQNGIIGFTSLKLAPSYIRAFQCDARNQIVIQLLETALNEFDLPWVLGSMTGWEDYSLLFFCKDFQDLAAGLGKLRDLGKSDITWTNSEGKALQRHLFATTCTQPAIRFGSRNLATELGDRKCQESFVEQLESLYRFESPLNWSVRLEIKPGHLHAVRERIFKLYADIAETLEFERIFGQSDLRCSVRNGTLKGFLQFFAHVIFSDLTLSNTSVRTVDSHLHIPIKEIRCGSGSSHLATSNEQARKRHNLSMDDDFQSQCIAAGLPARTVDALVRTFQKIKNFESSDLIQGDFIQIGAIFDRFLTGLQTTTRLLAFGFHNNGDVFNEKLAQKLSHHITEWLYLFERCLSDRYRGVYPAGESVSMRIATYFSSHHKYLAVSDFFGNASTNLLLDSIENRKIEVGIDPRAKLELRFASFLGNSPNFWCHFLPIELFGTSFVDLPSDSVFYPGELTLLAHEIGHHATISYLRLNVDTALFGESNLVAEAQELLKSRLYPLQVKAVKRLIDDESRTNSGISEILAELFSLCLCSRGDEATHGARTEDAITRAYPSSNLKDPKNALIRQRVKLAADLRRAASKAIFASLSEADPEYIYEGKYQFRFRELYEANKVRIEIVQHGQHCETDQLQADCLEILALLCRKSHFRCFLLGIADLATREEFSNFSPKDNLLKSFRELIQTAPSNDVKATLMKLDTIFYRIRDLDE